MKILLLLLLLLPISLPSETHFSWEEWIKDTFLNEDFMKGLDEDVVINDGTGLIDIQAPYRALDGANVPITISTKSRDILKYILIVDENPTPCCAIFEFDNMPAYVETNIRVNAYTYLRVLAEDRFGDVYMVTKFIKAAGGCSAPGLIESGNPKGTITVKSPYSYPGVTNYQFWHPNYSGMQFDQLTRTEIPADYIENVDIEFDNSSFRYEGTIGIAENVYFNLITEKGVGTITATDSDGNIFSKQLED